MNTVVLLRSFSFLSFPSSFPSHYFLLDSRQLNMEKDNTPPPSDTIIYDSVELLPDRQYQQCGTSPVFADLPDNPERRLQAVLPCANKDLQAPPVSPEETLYTVLISPNKGLLDKQLSPHHISTQLHRGIVDRQRSVLPLSTNLVDSLNNYLQIPSAFSTDYFVTTNQIYTVSR